jgi:hypothetical protein
MRVADRPLPPITLDPGACVTWPRRPVIALESRGEAPYQYDAGWQWDDPTLIWDAATVAPAFVDATCDFTGCDIDYGPPDEHGQFPAGRCAVTLDNRSGRWAAYNADGSPTKYGAGGRIAVWWTDRASGNWWAFYGRIATYDEHTGDVIELEAFDPFEDLAQPIGSFTPGAAGDHPGTRLAAIVTAAGATVRTAFATGTVALTVQATDQAPLEEMQTVTGSDGGVLYGDVDGTVVSTARTWRAGRSDQTVFPMIATNVCTAPIVLWDPVIATSDTHLAGKVILENVAGLKATATRSTDPHYVLAEVDQQWTSQAEGNQLAADLAAQLFPTRLQLASADLYPLDPKQPAVIAVTDWRLLDRVRILHDARTPTGLARVDVEALLLELHHAFTADTWVTSIATTRALTYIAAQLWDQTPFTWDDPAPSAVWGY